MLARLGKRPSLHAWKLLIQRCGASLFINSYLNRPDALMLNLMIKKAGMGLHATGDVVQEGAAHLSEQDLDFDDALNLPHAGIFGMATKSLEMGAFMALTVGQVGLHALGSLIESVGDELAQGALAAAIIYFHGMSLAADTLALDLRHRASPAMNRNFREAVWRMGAVAGGILLDFVRQRRDAFREKRRRVIKTLPRTAYEGIQNLFGRKSFPGGIDRECTRPVWHSHCAIAGPETRIVAHDWSDSMREVRYPSFGNERLQCSPHRWSNHPKLLHHLRELLRLQRLRAVAERVIGIGMHFHQQAVGACCDRGASHRDHFVAASGAVRWVGDDGQVRERLHHRDG